MTPEAESDLLDRVTKLEKTVRDIGMLIATVLALVPVDIVGRVLDQWGLNRWVAGLVLAVVWMVGAAAFWKWYGRDLRP
jgi:hypothetical protein